MKANGDLVGIHAGGTRFAAALMLLAPVTSTHGSGGATMQYRKVAETGMAAPGTEPGVVFEALTSGLGQTLLIPKIDEAGRVADDTKPVNWAFGDFAVLYRLNSHVVSGSITSTAPPKPTQNSGVASRSVAKRLSIGEPSKPAASGEPLMSTTTKPRAAVTHSKVSVFR